MFSGYKTFTQNSSAQTSKFYVANNATNNPFWGNNTIGNDGNGLQSTKYGVAPYVIPPTLITQSAILPFTCTTPLMQAQRLAPFQSLNDIAEFMTQDADLLSIITNTTTISNAATYLQKDFLYGLLKRPQVITVDVALQNFVTATQNTGIGNYVAVDSLIKTRQYATAKATNNIAANATPIEQNLKDINTQVLNKLINTNYVYTPSEELLVETIANKCPLTNGNTVYQARTLLQIIRQQFIEFTDSCNNVKPNGARLINTHDEKSFELESTNYNFVVFPNPSNGNITIETADDLSYNLAVYNVLGEKVVDLTVSNKQTLNLSSLPSATYVVLINYNGSLIKTERVSIIH